MMDLSQVNEDIRLVNNIEFISVDKDNMEFETLVSCYQVDALRRMTALVEFCMAQVAGESDVPVTTHEEQGDLFDRLTSEPPRSEDSGDHPVKLS